MSLFRNTIIFVSLLCMPASSQPSAMAQSQDVRHERAISFDVVSIKPNKEDGFAQIRGKQSDNFLQVIDMPVKSLICFAFDLQTFDSISNAPKWTETERYDIDARVSGEDYPQFQQMSLMKRKLMLQAVVAERFALRYHLEPRSIEIYELVVAKGGPRMKEAVAVVDASGGSYYGDGPAGIRANALSMSKLSQILTSLAGKQVIDKTGLAGGFDFRLKWDPATSANVLHHATTDSTSITLSPDPPIFSAIQEQLGLKLRPGRVELPVLVVDHIERPSPN